MGQSLLEVEPKSPAAVAYQNIKQSNIPYPNYGWLIKVV